MEVTAQAVKKAYEKTGLTPRRRTWYSPEDNCACGATVLALATDSEAFHNKEEGVGSHVEKICNILGFSSQKEVWAFADGFDSNVEATLVYETTRELELYLIGKEAAELVFFGEGE